MKLSIITWIHNRAHLLKFSLQALADQIGEDIEVELNVADEGSTDELDNVLASVSFIRDWTVTKYDTRQFKEAFQQEHNCPAPYYNALVALSTGDYIIKIDPEFVLVTDNFVHSALELLEQGKASFVMPLPHHTDAFDFTSLADIWEKWRGHEYPTHINAQTAERCNVYYGCVFNRHAFIDLGGVDLRFKSGISSEDDHLLDQWRRRYGNDSVRTLLDKDAVHLYHGGFSKGVPQELYHLVNRNADLRWALKYTYPNDGNFNSISYPNLSYIQWVNDDGELVVESGIKTVTTDKGEVDDGIVIGYVNRIGRLRE